MIKETYFNDIGVTLIRMYPDGESADVVGTSKRWRQEIDEIRVNYPHREPFNGLVVRVCHVDAPETKTSTQLFKYGAAGLKYHGKELVDILYKPSWGLVSIVRVLSHELFHWVAHESGLNRSTPWGILCLDWLVDNTPKGQASNEQETFAEVGASVAGTDEFRGYFSDGKEYKAPASVRAFVLALYAASKRARKENVDDILVDGAGLMWRETIHFLWWPFSTWYRVTPKGEYQIYKGRKWVSNE